MKPQASDFGKSPESLQFRAILHRINLRGQDESRLGQDCRIELLQFRTHGFKVFKRVPPVDLGQVDEMKQNLGSLDVT
jgi:hypothetical protein